MVGYWVPSEADKGASNTLVYLLAFPSRAARDKAWRAPARVAACNVNPSSDAHSGLS